MGDRQRHHTRLAKGREPLSGSRAPGQRVLVGITLPEIHERPATSRRPVILGALGLAVALVIATLFSATGTSPTTTTASPEAADAFFDPGPSDDALPDQYFPLVPREFIEAIYQPQFVAASATDWSSDTTVIGLAINGEAKAYPIRTLISREMVVDELGGEPVLVTWCPVCGTAMVHRREIDGQPAVFGVQGALYRNAMTWWDHETGSIWSQPLGAAIAGPLTGTSVDLLPAVLTTWGAWRDAHANTLALDAAGGASGPALETLLIVANYGGEARGYSINGLREVGTVYEVLGGVPIAVVIDHRPRSMGGVLPPSRRLAHRAPSRGRHADRCRIRQHVRPATRRRNRRPPARRHPRTATRGNLDSWIRPHSHAHLPNHLARRQRVVALDREVELSPTYFEAAIRLKLAAPPTSTARL